MTTGVSLGKPYIEAWGFYPSYLIVYSTSYTKILIAIFDVGHPAGGLMGWILGTLTVLAPAKVNRAQSWFTYSSSCLPTKTLLQRSVLTSLIDFATLVRRELVKIQARRPITSGVADRMLGTCGFVQSVSVFRRSDEKQADCFGRQVKSNTMKSRIIESSIPRTLQSSNYRAALMLRTRWIANVT